MPEISRFLGIIIYMYFNDHDPPHIHANYNEYRAKISIESFSLLDGSLPSRVLGLVVEWTELHRDELIEDWESIRTNGTYKKLQPLA